MTLIRFRYLQEQGIFNDRMALARAIDHYGFPKPIALGDNTLAWDLEKEVEPWLKSRPRRTPKCAAASKRPSAVVGDA
jgi:Prophage CP4-57 regulatory protein (AlpA)